MIANLKKEKPVLDNIQIEKSMKLLSEKYCHRCGGLMISEHCFDVDSTTGEFEIEIRKCLSCGETIDPTILKNRIQNLQNLDNHFPGPQSVFCPPNLAEVTAEDH